MAFADSNNVTIRFSREVAWGETPATPATTQLRILNESFSHNKETIVSNEIDSGRQRTALLEVADSAGGGFGFELLYSTEYESFMESAMRGTIASAVVAMASTVVAASTITGPAGTNFVASFAVGQWVKNKTSGEVAKISARSSTVLTCVGTTMVASTYASAAVNGRTLVNGTTKTSYFIETAFGGITAVKYQNGMRPNTMNLSIAAQQILTGTFDFVGKQGFVASTTVASSVVTSAQTNNPMTAAAHVTDVLVNDVKFSDSLNSISIDLNNNMRPRNQIASKFSAEPVDGGLDVTGNVNMYFQNISFYNRMINHTSFSMDYKIKDDSGNIIVISMPEMKATSGDPQAGGKDEDVFLSFEYQAIKDPTLAYTIRIDYLPA